MMVVKYIPGGTGSAQCWWCWGKHTLRLPYGHTLITYLYYRTVMNLDVNSLRKIYPKCQSTDYVLRGESLAHCNIMEYFVDIYEADMKKRYMHSANDTTDQHWRPGWKRNECILYLPAHPKYPQKLRVKRTCGHNQLPNFIGRFSPRSDDPDIRDFYCASMLPLLKPWREVTDLKLPSQTWSQAFDSFLSTSKERHCW